MGGHAFDTDGFLTPRMPPQVYREVKTRITSLLRQHFRQVGSPIEAPAKLDHGDIDVLMCEPIDASAVNHEHLAGIVGATRWKSIGDRNSINFALPWPDTATESRAQDEVQLLSQSLKRPLSSSSPAHPRSPSKSDSSTTLPIRSAPSTSNPRIIQLDISILPNLTRYNWLLFLHAHGDLWTVLGSTLRRYSLILTPSGFYVHIPEIEGQNKNLSRVKVTDQPGEVLRYMGLDEERYWRAFGSWDEMLDYACMCRFVDLGRGKRREEHLKEAEEARVKEDGGKVDKDRMEGIECMSTTPCGPLLKGSPGINGITPEETAQIPTPDPNVQVQSNQKPKEHPNHLVENGGLALRSNDRQRAAKRPLFTYFLTIYLPSHADKPPCSAAHFTKQEVIGDLKRTFGEEFKERYEKAREEGTRVVGVGALWANVRGMLKEEGAEGDALGYGIKGVKSWVCGEEWGWVDVGGEGEEEEGRLFVNGRGNGKKEADGESNTTEAGVGEASAGDTTLEAAAEAGVGATTGAATTTEAPTATPTNLQNNLPNPLSLSSPELKSLRAARLAFKQMRYDEVFEWAKGNWRKAGMWQRERDMDVSRRKMGEKMEKEREREGRRSFDLGLE